MVHSVEGSLKRLGVDYIDLLWIHFWEYSTDIADVMRNVNDLIQQGKVLHFGLCNTPTWVVARGQTVAEQRGWEPISALQYQYCLVSRDLEFEIIPCARALGISVNAYSPLDQELHRVSTETAASVSPAITACAYAMHARISSSSSCG